MAAQPETDEWEWVERYLASWALWMRHPALKLSAPARTPAFMGEVNDGYGDPEDIHELAGQDRAIQVIESTLDGVSPISRAAVMNVHLYAVWRFRVPCQVIYLNVRQKIGIRLRAHDFGPMA